MTKKKKNVHAVPKKENVCVIFRVVVCFRQFCAAKKGGGMGVNMRRDINKKLENVLNGMDKNTIDSGKRSVEQLLSTPEGRKLASQIQNVDKKKVIDAFMKMDSSEIKRKLRDADLSKLSNLKAEDILKKLR